MIVIVLLGMYLTFPYWPSYKGVFIFVSTFHLLIWYVDNLLCEAVYLKENEFLFLLISFDCMQSLYQDGVLSNKQSSCTQQ